MKIITRKEALAQGLKRYFTGKPCRWGHVAERDATSNCITCQNAWQKAYAQSEKGKAIIKARKQSESYKAYRKAYRQSEKSKAYHKAYDQSEKGKAISKAYWQSEKAKAASKAYGQSKEGTAVDVRRKLGLAPPSEYIESVHAGRLIKRELRKLKEQNL